MKPNVTSRVRRRPAGYYVSKETVTLSVQSHMTVIHSRALLIALHSSSNEEEGGGGPK